MSVHKNFSPFGPAVWPSIDNIYMNVLFYYIDNSAKVTNEMGAPFNEIEMASFMTCSKGYMGECGIRGGKGRGEERGEGRRGNKDPDQHPFNFLKGWIQDQVEKDP